MSAIPRRTLGKTELQVSVLGFGGGPIGFLQTQQQQVERMLNFLLDEGLNVIDTAAAYQGSEEAIGRAVSHRREQFVLISKCGEPGTDATNPSWTPAKLSQSVEQSLRRLKTDRLDVILLHSCDLETLMRGEALGALLKLREQGKVRFVGYSGDNEPSGAAAALPEIGVIETSVNICDQASLQGVLLTTDQRGAGVVAKRPLANAAWKDASQQRGLYAEYARTYAERFAQMKLDPAQLGFDGDRQQVWPEIALRFTISHPSVHTAIVGSTDPEHVRRNLEVVRRGPLPEDAVRQIRQRFRAAETAAGQPWVGQV